MTDNKSLLRARCSLIEFPGSCGLCLAFERSAGEELFERGRSSFSCFCPAGCRPDSSDCGGPEYP